MVLRILLQPPLYVRLNVWCRAILIWTLVGIVSSAIRYDWLLYVTVSVLLAKLPLNSPFAVFFTSSLRPISPGCDALTVDCCVCTFTSRASGAGGDGGSGGDAGGNTGGETEFGGDDGTGPAEF